MNWGRVKVELRWMVDAHGSPGRYQAWARLGTLMAGGDRGMWFIPDVQDEVMVMFGAGDPRDPYVMGALWNGVDLPPASMDADGANDIKRIRTRSGVQITLSDSSGQESLRFETPKGQSVTLEDGGSVIELVDSSGNRVVLSPEGVSIDSSLTVSVKATTVEVNAPHVSVQAPLSTFSGVVKCSALVTQSVVSASYTPGAGNIW